MLRTEKGCSSFKAEIASPVCWNVSELLLLQPKLPCSFCVRSVSSMFPYFCNFYIPSVYSSTVCAVVGSHFTVLYEPRATPHPPVYLYRFESFFLFLTLPLIHALCELLPSFYNLFALHVSASIKCVCFILRVSALVWICFGDPLRISNNDRLHPSSFFGYFFPYRNL